MKGGLLKLNEIIAGWVGKVDVPSKSFITYHSWLSRSDIQ